MWAIFRSKRRTESRSNSEESPGNIKPENDEAEKIGKRYERNFEKSFTKTKKINVQPLKNPEHHYFKGHRCSIPFNKQTKYDIEDNRRPLWNFILYITSVRCGDVRARYMFRSYAAISAEMHRQYTNFPCSIHPYSRLRLAIEIFAILTLQINTIILAVFFLEPNYIANLDRLDNVFEGLYFIVVIANFFTGYIQGRSSRFVILELKKIAFNYIRTWLVLDLCFCAGVIINFLPPGKMWEGFDSIAKVVVTLRLFQFVNNVLNVMGASEVTKTLVNTSFIIINYLLWNMIFQFALEFIAENTRTPTSPRACSWLTITHMWNATRIERQINAFNRAVGMLQQNSNLNLLEQEGCFETFFVIAWRIGKLIVIHCALKCMLMMFGLESAKARYFMLAQQVQTYMNQRRFPDRIKKKILKYFAVRYQLHFFEENLMMACVSGRLREDIIMHSSRKLVGEVEFLKNLPRSLLLQIGVKLKVVIFLAGDIIFKINTVGDCLYFIDKGTVAIYSESGQEICHLQDGEFFGEIALVIQPRFRTASAVAVTNCELFRLDKKDFESTIAIFPTVYEDIKKVAYQRVERTIVMDERHKSELRTGNEKLED